MHAADRTSQHTICLVGSTTDTFVAAMLPNLSDKASMLTTANQSGEASIEKEHGANLRFY